MINRSDSDAHPLPPRRFQLAGLAILCSAVVYGTVTYVVPSHTVALFLAISTGLTLWIFLSSLSARLRLSLSVVVLAIPLLVGGLCAVYLELRPVREQQRIIAQLKNSWFEVYPSSRNRNGYVTPSWLIRTVGPDVEYPIATIRGDLEQFQLIDYQRLDTTNLVNLQLIARSSVEISHELIDWINLNPQIVNLDFELHDFQSQNGDAIARLKVPCNLTIGLTTDVEWRLVGLQRARRLTIASPRVSARQLTELANVIEQSPSSLTYLELSLDRLSPGEVAALRGFNDKVQLGISGMRLDQQTVCSIASLGFSSYDLLNIDFATPPATWLIDDVGSSAEFLTLHGGDLSVEDYRTLLKLFGCQEALVERPSRNLPSENEPWLELFTDCEQLEIVQLERNGVTSFIQPDS